MERRSESFPYPRIRSEPFEAWGGAKGSSSVYWASANRTCRVSDESYLLDTSALLTLIEDEDGAERVEEVLREGQALISWISLLEVSYISQQERGSIEAERRYALVKLLPATVLWEATEPVLLTAARFKAAHRLSLADAMIAASAVQHRVTLLHKDPEFEALSDQVLLEALPYKDAGS
jgi:predicted nucleic acid-binding protein